MWISSGILVDFDVPLDVSCLLFMVKDGKLNVGDSFGLELKVDLLHLGLRRDVTYVVSTLVLRRGLSFHLLL